MSTYKKMVTRRGDVHFFKDGSVIEPQNIPVGVHALLTGDETKEVEFNDTQPENGKAESETSGESPQPPKETVPPVEKVVSAIHTPEKQLEPAGRKNMVSYLSGKPASRTRWLNSKEYPLTEEEYQTLNLGKLAQAVREKDEKDRLENEK